MIVDRRARQTLATQLCERAISLSKEHFEHFSILFRAQLSRMCAFTVLAWTPVRTSASRSVSRNHARTATGRTGVCEFPNYFSAYGAHTRTRATHTCVMFRTSKIMSDTHFLEAALRSLRTGWLSHFSSISSKLYYYGGNMFECCTCASWLLLL